MSDKNIQNNSSKRTSYKILFSILGITAIISSMFGGYLYFQSNLEGGLGSNGDSKTAQAANVPSVAFNPSDCATYLSNGGSSNNGVCYVKMYEKGGQLFTSLDIAPGELINVRNYYNNTNTSSVTNTSIADSIPTTFTRVGSVTNTYVDAAPVTLNNNLFTGQNLSVAPGAGYFGYGTDNTVTSSNLELGKKRYLQFVACNPDPAGANNFDSPVFLLSVDSQQAFSNADCVNAMGTSTAIKSKDFFADTLGRQYAQFVACNPDPSGVTYPNFDSTAYFGTGNTFANITDADCKAGLGQPTNGPAIKSKDFRPTILGNRYLQFLACNPDPSGPNPFDAPAAMIATNTIQTFTNQDCINGLGQSTAIVSKNIQPDLLDPTRGHGYISYTMQTPTSGLTNGQTFGTSSSMVGTNGNVQTFTSDKTGSLTIINANSANIISGIIPNDCTTYPGGTTSSETNNDGTACVAKTYVKNGIEYSNMEVAPGETVTVRLRYNNSATTSADQIRLKDNIPTGWTLSGNANAKYVDSTPVNLGTATSIFNSPDDTGLDVAPHIGFFGATASSGATDAVSSLELGKKAYASISTCFDNNLNRRYFFMDQFVNTFTGFSGSLPGNLNQTLCTNVFGSGNWAGNVTPNQRYTPYIAGKRYFDQSTCFNESTNQRFYYVQDSGFLTSVFSPFLTTIPGNLNQAQCVDIFGSGNWAGTTTLNQTYSIDSMGGRYMIQSSCFDESINKRVYYLNGFTNTPIAYPTSIPGNLTSTDCSNIFGSGAWNGTTTANFNYTIDALDQNRAHGYLEYQMTSPSNLTTGTVAGNPSVVLEDNDDDNWTTVNNPTGNATLIGVTTPAPNMNYTKLYSIDGGSTWSSTVSASTGQPIKVRLWNENTGGLSVTEGNIKDTIPNGFTYTTGSAKNCLNPSTILPTTPDNTELICDTGTSTNKDLLFTTLTSTNGVSPSAGLFDANPASTSVASGGTAFNAVAGAKEIGKKRYITQIRFSNNGNTETAINPNGSSLPWPATNTFTSPTNTPINSTQVYSDIQNACNNGTFTGCELRNFDIFSKRYITQLRFATGINTETAINYDTDSQIWPATNTYSSPTNSPVNASGVFFQWENACNSGTFTDCQLRNFDLLGKRYVAELRFISGGQTETAINVDSSSQPWPATNNYTTPSTSPINSTQVFSLWQSACDNGSFTGCELRNFDLLDASRSKSYIEYEMSASSSVTTGQYGTISTVSSTATSPEFTSINSGSSTDITITADPAFNVKKLLALPTGGNGTACPTDLSSYVSNLSGVDAGSEVCVRLAYQNKTAGAISNALINDTVPSGFTWLTSGVDTATRNCLTPASGSPVCDGENNIGPAIGNGGWPSSTQLTLAPHAGFYGNPINTSPAIMEMGKKRYIVQQTSAYIQFTPDAGCLVYTPLTYISNVIDSNGGGCRQQAFIDTTGSRYIIEKTAYANDDRSFGVYSGKEIGCGIQVVTRPSNSNAIGTYSDPCAFEKVTDILGFRYFSQKSFSALTDSSWAYANNFEYGCLTDPSQSSASNTLSTAVYTFSCAVEKQLDLLDPTNGSGYIQYKMTATPASNSNSITLPNVTLSGDNQTTVTSNATIIFNSTPITETDIPGLTVVCGTTNGSVTSAPVNSTTTCTFPLPANKTLPSDFKLSIGNGSIDAGGSTPAQSCTVTSNIVTCTNVPTGNSIGNIPIYGNLGSGNTATKTATGETVAITGSNFGNINWVFNPDQGGTSPLFRSQDNTSITVNNFRTIFDPTPSSNTRYTCILEYRNFNDRLTSTPTWTPLNTTPINYTTGTGSNAGCTVNLTKTQRANALNHSLRLTITDTTITNPSTNNPNTYTFYNEYIFRFQGAGVASGG